MPKKIKKIISIILCLCFLFNQAGFAQAAGAELNLSGFFSGLSRQPSQDKFRPLHLRYLSYDDNAGVFSLLLDKGDQPEIPEIETKKLFNYFLVGLSLPNDSFWVNLRPDSPQNIIDSYLEKTDVGRVLLESDVQLKKDTAGFTSPATPEGRKYWDALYKKAEELFGYDNITIPTLTRPWIVPGEIIVRESGNNAYIYKATLKVMLEQDYLKGSATYNFSDPRLKALNEYAAGLVRELIIPKLTQEINTSRRYAPLRQVYYSLILAQWFKTRFSSAGGSYASRINRRDLSGLISQISWDKQFYFQQYKDSFDKGEYNLRENHSTPFGQTVRTYMSGGISLGNEIMANIQAEKISSLRDSAIKASYTQQAVVSAEGNIQLRQEPPAAVSSPIATNEEKIKALGAIVTQGPEAFNDPAQKEILLSIARTIDFHYDAIRKEASGHELYIYAKAMDELFKLNPSLSLLPKDLYTNLRSISHDLSHIVATFNYADIVLAEVLDDKVKSESAQLEEEYVMLRYLLQWKGFANLNTEAIENILDKVVDYISRSDAHAQRLAELSRDEGFIQIVQKLTAENRHNLWLLELLRRDLDEPGKKSAVDIDAAIQKIVSGFSEKQLGSTELRVNLNAGGADVPANLLRLADAFKNLIGNGIDAINSRKRQEKIKGLIAVTSSVVREGDNGYVEIVFADNGTGIPAELLKDRKIFQDGFTTKGASGTGTGLYLVNEHIKFNEGTVDAYSDGPGTGARFVIRLPVVEARVIPIAKSAASSPVAIPDLRKLAFTATLGLFMLFAFNSGVTAQTLSLPANAKEVQVLLNDHASLQETLDSINAGATNPDILESLLVKLIKEKYYKITANAPEEAKEAMEAKSLPDMQRALEGIYKEKGMQMGSYSAEDVSRLVAPLKDNDPKLIISNKFSGGLNYLKDHYPWLFRFTLDNIKHLEIKSFSSSLFTGGDTVYYGSSGGRTQDVEMAAALVHEALHIFFAKAGLPAGGPVGETAGVNIEGLVCKDAIANFGAQIDVAEELFGRPEAEMTEHYWRWQAEENKKTEAGRAENEDIQTLEFISKMPIVLDAIIRLGENSGNRQSGLESLESLLHQISGESPEVKVLFGALFRQYFGRLWNAGGGAYRKTIEKYASENAVYMPRAGGSSPVSASSPVRVRRLAIGATLLTGLAISTIFFSYLGNTSTLNSTYAKDVPALLDSINSGRYQGMDAFFNLALSDSSLVSKVMPGIDIAGLAAKVNSGDAQAFCQLHLLLTSFDLAPWEGKVNDTVRVYIKDALRDADPGKFKEKAEQGDCFAAEALHTLSAVYRDDAAADIFYQLNPDVFIAKANKGDAHSFVILKLLDAQDAFLRIDPTSLINRYASGERSIYFEDAVDYYVNNGGDAKKTAALLTGPVNAGNIDILFLLINSVSRNLSPADQLEVFGKGIKPRALSKPQAGSEEMDELAYVLVFLASHNNQEAFDYLCEIAAVDQNARLRLNGFINWEVLTLRIAHLDRRVSNDELNRLLMEESLGRDTYFLYTAFPSEENFGDLAALIFGKLKEQAKQGGFSDVDSYLRSIDKDKSFYTDFLLQSANFSLLDDMVGSPASLERIMHMLFAEIGPSYMKNFAVRFALFVEKTLADRDFKYREEFQSNLLKLYEQAPDGFHRKFMAAIMAVYQNDLSYLNKDMIREIVNKEGIAPGQEQLYKINYENVFRAGKINVDLVYSDKDAMDGSHPVTLQFFLGKGYTVISRSADRVIMENGPGTVRVSLVNNLEGSYDADKAVASGVRIISARNHAGGSGDVFGLLRYGGSQVPDSLALEDRLKEDYENTFFILGQCRGVTLMSELANLYEPSGIISINGTGHGALTDAVTWAFVENLASRKYKTIYGISKAVFDQLNKSITEDYVLPSASKADRVDRIIRQQEKTSPLLAQAASSPVGKTNSNFAKIAAATLVITGVLYLTHLTYSNNQDPVIQLGSVEYYQKNLTTPTYNNNVYKEAVDGIMRLANEKGRDFFSPGSLARLLVDMPDGDLEIIKSNLFDCWQVYQSKYFSDAAKGMTPAARYILASSVYDELLEYGLEASDEENVASATKDVMKFLSDPSTRGIQPFSGERNVINFFSSDSVLSGFAGNVESIEASSGNLNAVSYKGDGENGKFLQSIAASKGKTTVFIYEHGDRINIQELADALLKREGSLDEVIVIFHACESGKLKNSFRQYLIKNGATGLPLVITTSSKDQPSIVNVIRDGSGKVVVYDDPFIKALNHTARPVTVGGIFEIQKDLFDVEKITVSQPKAVSSPVVSDMIFLNTPRATLSVSTGSGTQFINEFQRLADQITKDYSEDDFRENMGLVVGTKEGNAYRINRLIPVTEFADGTTADYLIPSRAEVVRIIETELRDNEQILGDYHNHSFERLRSNQAPGPSAADATGGGYLNIPGYENRIVDDRLGIVLEPELDLDKITMDELADFHPANARVIVYPYITPNRGLSRTLENLGRIYLDELLNKENSSESVSSPVDINASLSRLKQLRTTGDSDASIKEAEAQIAMLLESRDYAKDSRKQLYDELVWWSSRLRSPEVIAKLLLYVYTDSYIEKRAEFSPLLEKLKITPFQIRDIFNKVLASRKYVPQTTIFSDEDVGEYFDLGRQLQQNWYYNNKFMQEYTEQISSRLARLNVKELHGLLDTEIKSKYPGTNIVSIIILGSYLYGLKGFPTGDLDLVVVVDNPAVDYVIHDLSASGRSLVKEGWPTKLVDASIKSKDYFQAEKMDDPQAEIVRSALSSVVKGTGIVVYGKKIVNKDIPETNLLACGVSLGKMAAKSLDPDAFGNVPINKRFSKAYKRLWEAYLALSQIQGVSIESEDKFIDNLLLFYEGILSQEEIAQDFNRRLAYFNDTLVKGAREAISRRMQEKAIFNLAVNRDNDSYAASSPVYNEKEAARVDAYRTLIRFTRRANDGRGCIIHAIYLKALIENRLGVQAEIRANNYQDYVPLHFYLLVKDPVLNEVIVDAIPEAEGKASDDGIIPLGVVRKVSVELSKDPADREYELAKPLAETMKGIQRMDANEKITATATRLADYLASRGSSSPVEIIVESDTPLLLRRLVDNPDTRRVLEDLNVNKIGVTIAGDWDINGTCVESGVHIKEGKTVTTYRLTVSPNASASDAFHEVLHAVWRNDPNTRQYWNMKNWGKIKTRDRGKLDDELRNEEAFCDLLEWEMFGGVERRVSVARENERLTRNEEAGRLQEMKKFFSDVMATHPYLSRVLSVLNGSSSPVSLQRARQFLKIAALTALLSFIDPVPAGNGFAPSDNPERIGVIDVEYATNIIREKGWAIKVLSMQEWEGNVNLKGMAYHEAGAVTLPSTKTIYYGGGIPSAGHLSHEALHVLQSSFSEQVVIPDTYDRLEKLLEGNKEATQGLRQLYNIYASVYNPGMTDAIKGSKELNQEEKQSALRFVAANETFALILGNLVDRAGQGDQGVTFASCSLDQEMINRIIEGIKNNPPAQEELKNYYIKIGLDAGRINKLFSQSVNAASSSPVEEKQTADKTGGIDFRSLPVTTQPAGVSPRLLPASSLLQAPARINVNLEEELQQIRTMINSGIIPSNERLKEYAQACFSGMGSEYDINKMFSCIADILRMEEDRAEATDPQLRQLIMVLESGIPESEMCPALAAITFSAKDPALIGP